MNIWTWNFLSKHTEKPNQFLDNEQHIRLMNFKWIVGIHYVFNIFSFLSLICFGISSINRVCAEYAENKWVDSLRKQAMTKSNSDNGFHEKSKSEQKQLDPNKENRNSFDKSLSLWMNPSRLCAWNMRTCEKRNNVYDLKSNLAELKIRRKKHYFRHEKKIKMEKRTIKLN